jgi:hypothetical protein
MMNTVDVEMDEVREEGGYDGAAAPH